MADDADHEIEIKSAECLLQVDSSIVNVSGLGLNTIRLRISNSTCAPAWAVFVVASYCGATSTTSPPTRSTPFSPRRSSSTSRVVSPPTYGVPVPGAKAGSTLSTSKDR